MKEIERIQDEIEDLIRQDNRDFDFDNICPTIDWRDTRAIAEYVIKARIEELERIRGKLGTLNGQIFDHFKNERIAELKEGLK